MMYRWKLSLLLGATMVARVGYVLAQASSDPAFSQPMLDGEYYLAVARSITAGAPSPESGAFYLAPLYPGLVAAWMAVGGEQLVGLYLVQQAAMVGAAALLAALARRAAGDGAGLAAAGLASLYHPFLFFSSRPLGESISVLLLVAAVWLADRSGGTKTVAAGLLAGLASLARPNLLLVPAAWVVRDAVSRRWPRGLAVAAGVALVLGPVTLRNAVASGHFVPISSNAGITLYHGNGRGARGTFVRPSGLSGRVMDQRKEATALARARTGLPLDDVEADRWWGEEAIRTRMADPWETLWLLCRRILLVIDNDEHGLDYAPSLDENPWRFAAPLPFAAIFALAVAGLVLRGLRGTGGSTLWLAAGASAVAPVVFFAASRYRLPLVALMCVPGGVGVSALGSALVKGSGRREILAVGAAVAAAALAVLLPSGDLSVPERATSLSNLAVLVRRQGRLEDAERLARQALVQDPSSSIARFNLGVFLTARGQRAEAESAFREVLRRDPGFAEAAVNLSSLLLSQARAAEAVPILRRALAARPAHAKCWKNLVAALALSGDVEAARAAAAEALRVGVIVDNVPFAPAGPSPRR